MGSGVVVRSVKDGDVYHNVVFTVAHVIQEAEGFYLPYSIYVPQYKNWSELTGYDEYPVTVYKRINRTTDAAVLVFDSKKPVPVADIDLTPKLYLGNEVFHVGAGWGHEHRLDFGRVTSLKSSPGGPCPPNLLRTSVFTVGGDSGGPVFHEYKVVGVTQGVQTTNYPVSPQMTVEVPHSNASYSVPLKGNFTAEDVNYPRP